MTSSLERRVRIYKRPLLAPTPTGQLTPVLPSPQYPNGFLYRSLLAELFRPIPIRVCGSETAE
jgi:hypothetical protein